MGDRRSELDGAPRLRRRAAAVVIAWAVSEPLLLSGDVSRWAALAFGLLVATPLMAGRRAPVPVAVTVVGAYLAQYALQLRMDDAMSGEMAVAFALFGVGAYAPSTWRRTAFAVALAAAVPGGVWLISALDLGKVDAVYRTQYLYLCGVAFAGVVPGFALSSRRREVAVLQGEVDELCANAAAEISVAVDEERRVLSRDLVRVVEALIADIQRLIGEARQELAGATRNPSRQLGCEMASAATRAADELRLLLATLSAPDGPAGASDAERRAAGGRITLRSARAAAGVALPVVLLGVLSVVDRAQLPSLPVTVATTSGQTLTIAASSVSAPVGYLLAALTPLALLVRHRLPLVAVGGVSAVVALRVGVGEINSLGIAHVFVLGALAYNAGAWSRGRAEAGAGLAVTLATAGLCWALEDYRFETLVYAYMVGVLVATWSVGRVVCDDLREGLALRGRAAALAAQRAQLRRVAVQGQRRDVAREMHDVVGHGLSLIVVQSGVVDVLARRDASRALSAVDQVESAAQSTLAELGALRAALGTPDGDGVDGTGSGASAFCHSTIERIVADARSAGQPVLAYIDRHVDELAAEQRATIVRVAQEALTNARKHAGRAPTALEIVVRADAVRLEVRNDAPAPGSALLAGAGLGLRGMSERVQALGGRLDAGPRDGGWIVSAELPRPDWATSMS